MVYGTAVRLLGDPREAEDISQTVFLKAFERFEALRRSPSVGGWLKTVTTNLCLNHLSRVRSRWRLFSQIWRDTESAEVPYEDLQSTPGVQATDMERAEEFARLEQGVRSLPQHQRLPIVLYHFHERSYVEIARLLNVSLSKVKTDIHRGREALRRFMVMTDDA